MDHYETLGVSRDASKQEIIVAHRSLAAKAHPDAGGSVDEFKRIQKAYRILSDERARAHYDETGREFNGDSEVRSQAATFVLDEFMKDSGRDPMKAAISAALERQRHARKVAADSAKKARKLRAKIVRFEQRNANTSNPEARDDLVLVLLARYEDIEKHRKKTEATEELFGQVAEYLDGLECPPDESEPSPFMRPASAHAMFSTGPSWGPMNG